VLPGISLEPIFILRGQCCLNVDAHIRSAESLIHFPVLPLEPLVQGQWLPRYLWGTRILYSNSIVIKFRGSIAMQYWLMKSEPSEFSIDDLKRVKVEPWDGVRNYQARNMMNKEMKKGDLAFMYHSNCDEIGIVGIMTIAREGYVDHTAFDKKEKHYDAKSNPENPRWFMVDVRYKRKLKRTITLAELKKYKKLAEMQLLKRGNRLSIMPISKKHWNIILSLE